jgi:hypothetical protein
MGYSGPAGEAWRGRSVGRWGAAEQKLRTKATEHRRPSSRIVPASARPATKVIRVVAGFAVSLALLGPAVANGAQAHCGAGGTTSCVPDAIGTGFLSLLPGSETTAGSGLAVDEASGDLYVADTGNHRVDEFAGGGALVRAWGWGVSNGAAEAQVCTSEGSCRAGLSGSDAGELIAPTFIAVDQSDGDVYVGDSGDDLVSKFTASGALVDSWGNNGTAEAPNGQLAGTKSFGGFGPLAGLAVDPSGDLLVYVGGTALAENVHVYRFAQQTAAFVETWSPEHVDAGAYSPQGIGVDQAGRVYVSEKALLQALTPPTAGHPSGTWLGSLYEGGAISGFAIDSGRSTRYVDEEGRVIIDISSQCVPSTSQATCPATATFGAGDLDEAAGLAIDSTTGGVYAADAGPNEVLGFPVTIEANTEAPTAVTANHAALAGEVNPEGHGISRCVFQYGPTEAYGKNAPCLPESLGAGGTAVQVHAEVPGLTGGTSYHYRLRVVNADNEEVLSEDQNFSTLVTAKIKEPKTEEVTATSAVVRATVNPEGLSASCEIEYGTSSAYGLVTPCTPASLPAGTQDVQVTSRLEPLTPGTTYHWRAVVSDANGTVRGSDNTFVDLQPTSFGGCSNEARREESNVSPKTGLPYSMSLPDCRALEMVTPAAKNAALFSPIIFGLPPTVAADGSRVIASTIQCFAGALSCTGDRVSKGPPFEFDRTSHGWEARPLTPSASQFEITTVWGYDADTGMVLYSSPVGSSLIDEFYAREPDGTMTGIGPIAENTTFVAISSSPNAATGDLSHVLYESSPDPLWPSLGGGEQQRSLYEYSGTGHTAPFLVGVSGENDPGSASLISVCGTSLGSTSSGAIDQALSDDGKIVYFTADGPCEKGSGSNSSKAVPADRLYARVDGEAPDAHTVAISTSQCGSASAHDEIECREDETRPDAAFLEGVSSNGAVAAFVSTQKLTDEASEDGHEGDTAGVGRCRKTVGPNGCNLYLSELGHNAGERLTDVSAGDSSGHGPQVQGVMAMASDGSHVYFVARGVLTSGANPAGLEPVEGAANLYVYEKDAAHPSGRTAFIATLLGDSRGTRSEAAQWGETRRANVTPDGNVLVFTSRGALTQDTSGEGAAEVYRYDATTEQLERISFGESGFNNNGNASSGEALLALPTSIVGSLRTNPTMSDDGSVVFFESSIGLTPTALDNTSLNGNAEEFAENVYEWEANGHGSCAMEDGCVSLISDGLDASEGNGGNANSTLSSVELLGSDSTGENVFFTTVDPLVKADTDTQLDYYDARVNGGIEEPVVSEPCAHSAKCPGEGSQPLVAGPLGSTVLSATGDLPPVQSVKPISAKPKPPTRAQLLAKALKKCRAKKKQRLRAACNKAAEKKYGPVHKGKRKAEKAKRGTKKKAGRSQRGAK